MLIKLNNTIIKEPIGFDGFETQLDRGEYHGMSVENSVGTLEFYGLAYDIIKRAYDADIDSDVTFSVEDDGNEIYTGKVDLSTCEFQDSDYQSVTARVGDAGAKTTFNNRIDTDVDVNTDKTIDGAEITSATWREVDIPTKHLKYTNDIHPEGDILYPIPPEGHAQDFTDILSVDNKEQRRFVFLPYGDVRVNEFGTLTTYPLPPSGTGGGARASFTEVDARYAPDPEHNKKYGNSFTDVTVDLDMQFVFRDAIRTTGTLYWRFKIVNENGNGTSTGWQSKSYNNRTLYERVTVDTRINLSVGFPASASLWWFLEFRSSHEDEGVTSAYTATILVRRGSFVKMTMYDNIPSEGTPTKMVQILDAANVVTSAISEKGLRAVSDYYGSGKGYWRFLTNGYKIRGLFTDSVVKRNMPLSFKRMVESMNMLDCIGWGFSKEDGVDVVRIEPWDWFYKSDIVAQFASVKEVKTSVDTDGIITKFGIGYKKHETNDQFNSIDSVHGSRQFVSKIKAISKSVDAECEFIADNYAIELTRRARVDVKDSEEFNYDEDVFVFELTMSGSDYIVQRNVLASTHLERPQEQINSGITPRRCAERWKGYLFRANNTNDIVFTTGEINYIATITRQDSPDEAANTLAEDANIPYEHSILCAEVVTFECPVKHAQYKAILANPYGLVEVNGIKGWIRSFKYNFKDHMGEFQLIKKYE